MVKANANIPRVIEVKWVYSQGKQLDDVSYFILQGIWALVKNKGFPKNKFVLRGAFTCTLTC